MLSALLMLRRMRRAVRFAARDEEFLPVLGAGAFMLVIGTVAFALAEGWSPVDGAYFSLSLLTTTSQSDPDLVLTGNWIKVFAMAYQLVGIGVLVELLRRLAFGFIEARKDEVAATSDAGGAPDATG